MKVLQPVECQILPDQRERERDDDDNTASTVSAM
jgi:hypothetical protein